MEPADDYSADQLAILAQLQFLDPDYVIIFVVPESYGERPNWRGLERLVLTIAGRGGDRCARLPFSEWIAIRKCHLGTVVGIFLDMNLVERIRVKRLPTDDAVNAALAAVQPTLSRNGSAA